MKQELIPVFGEALTVITKLILAITVLYSSTLGLKAITASFPITQPVIPPSSGDVALMIAYMSLILIFMLAYIFESDYYLYSILQFVMMIGIGAVLLAVALLYGYQNSDSWIIIDSAKLMPYLAFIFIIGFVIKVSPKFRDMIMRAFPTKNYN